MDGSGLLFQTAPIPTLQIVCGTVDGHGVVVILRLLLRLEISMEKFVVKRELGACDAKLFMRILFLSLE